MKVRRRLELFAGAFHRQGATVVGERMDHHRGVPCAPRPFRRKVTHVCPSRTARAMSGPSHHYGPCRRRRGASDQVGGGEVVVAGDRDQRPPSFRVTCSPRSASCRSRSALDQQRQARFFQACWKITRRPLRAGRRDEVGRARASLGESLMAMVISAQTTMISPS